MLQDMSKMVCALLISLCFHVAATTDLFAQSVPQAIVLRNGSLLHGTIDAEGAEYVVRFGGRGEMRIPEASVDFVCSGVQDALRIKHRRIASGDTFELVKLSDWCVHVQLYDEARRILWDVQRIDPSLPGLQSKLQSIDLLIQQIEALALERVERQAAVQPDLPSDTGMRQAASLDSVFAAGKSEGELPDYVTTELFSKFVTEVQPRLVNGCSAARCHSGVTTADFRLERVVRGQALHRTLAERNLLATLEYVDPADPARSQILLSAGQPHAQLRTPTYPPVLSPHYKAIETWVSEVAQSMQATGPSRTNQIVQAGAVFPSVGSPGDSNSSARFAGDVSSGHEAESQVRELDQDRQNVEGGFYVPLDPFDAEIFNRKHFASDATPLVPAQLEATAEPAPRASVLLPPNQLNTDQLNSVSRPITTPPPR